MAHLSSDKSASVHHVELWVGDLARAEPEWAWLFGELGWELYQDWPAGRSWRAGDGAYVVVEQSPDVEPGPHRRTAPGMNHLALGTDRATVDRVAADGDQHGWALLFPDRHPYAGGPEHYAAYVINSDGFEVELVARDVFVPEPVEGQPDHLAFRQGSANESLRASALTVTARTRQTGRTLRPSVGA